MAFPGGLQLGGGVTADNAALYLGAGASHVIVTSWVFREGRLDRARLAELVRLQTTSSSTHPLSSMRHMRRSFGCANRLDTHAASKQPCITAKCRTLVCLCTHTMNRALWLVSQNETACLLRYAMTKQLHARAASMSDDLCLS